VTPQQQRAVAALLLHAAADAVEILDEVRSSSRDAYDHQRGVIDEVSLEEIRAQFAMWLRGLPGNDWDSRLPMPWAE